MCKPAVFLVFAFGTASTIAVSPQSWAQPLLRGVKIPEDALKDAVQEAQLQAQVEAGAWHLGACGRCQQKAYTDPCPVGWKEAGDHCEAPLGYGGLCSRTLLAAGLSRLEKASVETSCDVCWACDEDRKCTPDWALPCPLGYAPLDVPMEEWHSRAGMQCVALATVDGECDETVFFASIDDKLSFSRRCRASWPCRTEGEQCRLTACPKDWTRADPYCIAPAYYKHTSCGPVQRFSGWTDDVKLEFGTSCSVAWGCNEEETAAGPIQSTTCELDLDGCPLHWRATEDGKCEPPLVASACVLPANVRGMTRAEKLKWASSCLSEWPRRGGARMRVSGDVGFEVVSDFSGPLLTQVL